MTLTYVYTTTTAFVLRRSLAFPPLSGDTAFIATTIAILAFAAYIHLVAKDTRTADVEHVSGKEIFPATSIPRWIYAILVLLIFVRAALWARQIQNTVSYHPIDLLLYDAQQQHDAYVQRASASRSFKDAVLNYRARYNRHPPPGFDHWYRYATERNSAIIDEFDSINDMLLPYYALQPVEIRDRTRLLLQTRWHDATALSIRDGRADISSYIPDDHRWMLASLADMINKFAEWLPDMDMAFNINDEPRIAVRWETLNKLEQASSQITPVARPQNEFSKDRAAQWPPTPDPADGPRLLDSLGAQPIFYSHGSVHCSPNAAARTQRHWDRSKLCTSCVAPHSIGAFLANWTKATDICHQPDLAELHGFYMSPSAFRATNELLPLFSQSKAPGFNDITYPSVWNWLEKTKYAPNEEHPDIPFTEKNSTLFWRGATTEGISPNLGQWKGMSRQRFIHTLNDINVAGSTQALLLPARSNNPDSGDDPAHPQPPQKYTYTQLPISTLTSLIKTDAHFVEQFRRCWDIDCLQQLREFGLAETSNFQHHWQYKYLLDLDGAGFSGRFLPFLQSHSLPLKAALFREWWDDRVTAWQHFVPLDLRGHGLWATLAYFVGLEGKVNGKEIKMAGHEREAERIAEQGREWAEKVLRKEDMEIYFFRLLLEWGRLTDDARDEIGFGLEDAVQ